MLKVLLAGLYQHPNTPTLLTNSSNRVGYNENKIVETKDFIYLTYLDYEYYNHIIKYDKEMNLIEDKKLLNKGTDNHSQLDIFLDSNDKLHLIGGGHSNDNNYYYVQLNDTLTFSEYKIPINLTYPKIMEYNKNIYIIYRQSLEQNKNLDRWCIVKTHITSSSINFNEQEVITITGNDNMFASYGHSSNIIDNKLYFNCNWYNVLLDSSDSGFIIYKNLDNNYWYNVNNQKVTLPVDNTLIHFTGKEYRQTNVVKQNEKQYFINSHLNINKVEVYEINNNLNIIPSTLPQNIYVNDLQEYDNILYCLATEKGTKNVVLYSSKDGFRTIEKTIISNCGNTPIWTSCNLFIGKNGYIIRVLNNNSNLLIIKE